MILEPSGLPDDMRSHGTRSQLKATNLKITGDRFLSPRFGDHEH